MSENSLAKHQHPQGASQDASQDAPGWLITPIELEEQRGFRLSRNTMRLIAGLAAAVLVWAAITPIRELSLARGQLIPTSQVRPLQHLEGGIVEALLVKEGQIVEQGQPLMRLQTVMADSELAALKARAQNLVLQKERLDALIARRTPELSSFKEASFTQVADHQQVYDARLDHRMKENQLLLMRIAQRRSELATLQNDIKTQRRLLEIGKEQFEMRQQLAINGSASRRQVLESLSIYEQARGLVATTEGRIATLQETLQEAEAASAEAAALAQKTWSEEQTKTASELAEVQESIKKQMDKVDRLTIRAPARGRVQQMLQRSAGEVVRAGESIARIVPLDDALVAEIFVKPDDIAAVKVGNKAELKVTAYDFSKFGKVKGEITDISPTTVEHDDKRLYYKAIVAFDPHRSDRHSLDWHLQPGMAVDAEIISGSKTLMQYVLKPIHRGLDAAFTER
jgi:membrane fusion protein, adhesin transport system